jgi:hypothetical protein
MNNKFWKFASFLYPFPPTFFSFHLVAVVQAQGSPNGQHFITVSGKLRK